ncbi:MAG: hypothetical protein ACFE9L_00070 [Candidatus Hodarchaeota archaeon]
MKFTEFSYKYPVSKDDVTNTMFEFFKKGEGKSLINFKDQYNLPIIFGKAKQEYKLKTAIKKKISWIIDPDLDQILGQIENNEVTTCFLSPLFLLKQDLSKLKKEILVLVTKAFKKNQILFVVAPSLTQTNDTIERLYDYLEENLKQIYQIDQGLSNYKNPSPVLVQTFGHRKEDIEKDLLKQLIAVYQEGSLFFSDGVQTKIGRNNIDSLILNLLKETFSKINAYAYLGQANISKTDI